MQDYSHGSFQVTGYKLTTNSRNAEQDIRSAWATINKQNLLAEIEHKEYPGVHNVYFNYINPENLEERGYDVVIGFVTTTGAIQTNDLLTTVTIPEQDYKYVEVKGNLPEAVIEEWQKINALTKSKLNRAFSYDLDMYAEDMQSCMITVSVLK